MMTRMDAWHWLLLGLTLLAVLIAAILAHWWLAAKESASREHTRAEELAAANLKLGGHHNAQENRAIRAEAEIERVRSVHEAEMRRVQDVARAQLTAADESAKNLRIEQHRAHEALKEKFQALAGDILQRTQQAACGELDQRRVAFDQLLKPMAETLRATQDKISQLDKNSAAVGASIREQLENTSKITEQLRGETRKLGDALRRPEVRGRYGELQLKRVAELAGMSQYCDFALQEQLTDTDGNALRPDMIVRMPSGRSVAIDAKTNLQAYIDAAQAGEADRDRHLDRFAQHVADQAKKLADKGYWRDLQGSPEFVVMFMPAEHFLDAALARRPALLEDAARRGVILATPATLIALLRAVAVGYKEERLAQAAEELRELGRKLHEQAATAFEPLDKLARHLENAMEAYNQFVGSYQSRLRPTLLRFEEAGVKGKRELPAIETVSARARALPEANPAR